MSKKSQKLTKLACYDILLLLLLLLLLLCSDCTTKISQKKHYIPQPSQPQPDVLYDNRRHIPLLSVFLMVPSLICQLIPQTERSLA